MALLHLLLNIAGLVSWAVVIRVNLWPGGNAWLAALGFVGGGLSVGGVFYHAARLK